MKNILTATAKTLALTIAAIALITVGQSTAKADTVVFSTTGVFSGGSGVVSNGGTTVTFTSGGNTTTLTFAGTTATVNTPVGSSFGDITATATGAPVAIDGNFTLSFIQTTPGPTNTGSIGSTLSGSLGVNSGIATLTFNQTSVVINGITYTVNPMYTLAVPTSGAGGGAQPGVTTIQGTVTGSAVPEPTTMLLLGTGLTGLAGAARRKLKGERTEEEV